MIRRYHSQASLIAIIAEDGPKTARELCMIVYGSSTRKDVKLMCQRIDTARRAKLLTFAGYGEKLKAGGMFPAKWALAK
jgi:hypothetical protein